MESKTRTTQMTVVCNSHDPDHMSDFERFLELLSEGDFNVSVRDLGNSHQLYKILGSVAKIRPLKGLADRFSLRKVTLPIVLDTVKERQTNLNGLDTLAKHFVSRYYGLSRSLGVETTVFVPPKFKSTRTQMDTFGNPIIETLETKKRVLVFTPFYRDTGDYLYDTQVRLNDIHYSMNLNDWKDYIALPYSPLTHHAVILCEQKGLVAGLGDLTEYDGLTLVKTTQRGKLSKYRDAIELQIDALTANGCIGVEISELSPIQVDLMEELASCWGCETVARYSDTIVFRVKLDNFPHYSSQDMGDDPREWLLRNLRRVSHGQLPVTVVRGPWGLWRERGDTPDVAAQIQARIAYLATRAYDKVAREGSYYMFSDKILHVRDDLGILLTLGSKRDYEAFYQHMLSLLESKNKITAIKLDTPDDVVAALWAIQQTPRAGKLAPLGFHRAIQANCKPETLSYHIVVDVDDKPKIKKLVSDPGLFDSAKKKARDLFVESLKDCNGGADIVSGEEISEMGLAKLSDVVKVSQPNSNAVYCYDGDTIMRLGNRLDPVSRAHLSFETLRRATTERFFDDEVIGLVDSGPIKGFIESRKGVLVRPEVGVVSMRRVFSSDMEPEVMLAEKILGAQYEVEVTIARDPQEPRTANLMVLSLPVEARSSGGSVPEYDSVLELIQKLWSSGALMNPWARAVKLNLGEISVKPLTLDPVLENAGESIKDGELAVKMLRAMDEDI